MTIAGTSHVPHTLRWGLCRSNLQGQKNPGNLDGNRNTHEVEHENEPESDPVSSGRRRVTGVSRDGEDSATPPRCAVNNRIYPERRARVRRPLCGCRRRALYTVRPDSAARFEPRLPERQPELISVASIRRAAPSARRIFFEGDGAAVKRLGEQRYGDLYLIGSRGYQFILANLPLSRSLHNALSEIRFCCRS